MSELKLFDGAFPCSSISSQPVTLPYDWNDADCIKWAKEHEYSYVLLESEMGHITHYLKAHVASEGRQSIHPGYLLSHSSGLFEAFEIIKTNGFVLLLEGSKTSAIITWQDLNRPPIMAWIFSQISLMEIQLKNKLRIFSRSFRRAHSGSDESLSLLDVLPTSRMERATKRYDFLQQEQAECDLIDTLEIADVLNVSLRFPALRNFLYPETTSKERNKLIYRIERLRNAVSHGRSIVTNFEEVGKQYFHLSLVRNILDRLDELEKLTQAYESTLYRTKEGDEFLLGEPIKWGDTENKILEPCAFITAYNPWSEPLSEEVNQKRHQELIGACEKKGWKFREGEGVDKDGVWPAEKSLLVWGFEFAQAYELAGEFGQLTFLWIEEGVVELHWVV